ncbi:MAG: HesA/MoeB/ThiF family protein [Saccharofermentanales bacterium]
MQQLRYERQAGIPASGGNFNDILASSSILICGAGGLGCPAAVYLAAAGVGKLGIVDNDFVAWSNLNRQILYNPADLGKEKTFLAKKQLEVFNPDTTVMAYQETITDSLLDRLLQEYDLVMDCTDNYSARLLIATGAYKSGKPSVCAGVSGLEGFVLITPDQASACIGCLYTEAPVITAPPQVLGATAGMMGSMAAAQAILLLTKGCDFTSGRNMMLIDIALMESDCIKLEKNPHCRVCGCETRGVES